MGPRLGLLLVLSLLLPAPRASAQSPSNRLPADTTALIARARASTARFASRSEAVAAGYRRVGGDFPAMGEHWVHPRHLMAATAMPDQPAMLSYVTIGDSAVLAGVAWALPLPPDAEYPIAPVPLWHDHGGTIDAASFDAHRGLGQGWRLAVLHAWVWLGNPEGTFRTDNWALPWIRLGLAPPAHPDPDAARALSLVAGGMPFWTDWLRYRGRLSDTTQLRDLHELVRANVHTDAPEALLAERWRTLAAKLGLPTGTSPGH